MRAYSPALPRLSQHGRGRSTAYTMKLPSAPCVVWPKSSQFKNWNSQNARAGNHQAGSGWYGNTSSSSTKHRTTPVFCSLQEIYASRLLRLHPSSNMYESKYCLGEVIIFSPLKSNRGYWKSKYPKDVDRYAIFRNIMVCSSSLESILDWKLGLVRFKTNGHHHFVNQTALSIGVPDLIISCSKGPNEHTKHVQHVL